MWLSDTWPRAKAAEGWLSAVGCKTLWPALGSASTCVMLMCYPADAVELVGWLKQNDLGSPWESLHSQSPTEETKPGKFPLAGFLGTLPKWTWASSFREGAAWPSEAGVRGPTIQSQCFLSFALWFGPCHFPALGRHQARWYLYGPFQLWHPTHLGWVSWRTNLSLIFIYPFQTPSSKMRKENSHMFECGSRKQRPLPLSVRNMEQNAMGVLFTWMTRTWKAFSPFADWMQPHFAGGSE